MDLPKIKNIFFKTLIVCLIAAAGVAVVTLLIGKFNDVSEKAIWTILAIATHALIGIAFITSNEKQETFDNLEFFTESTFAIIVFSFITSILGIWGVMPGELVGKLYILYFVLLFAVLHGEVLSKTLGIQDNINKIVAVNFIFMVAVVGLLLPLIFSSDFENFPGFYYRLLAACGIIDATLTMIAVILHRLYVQKHPKVSDPVFAIKQVEVPGQPGQTREVMVEQKSQKKHMNVFVVILLIFVGFQVLGSIFFFLWGLIGSGL
ncbi:MAG TPA: hypothetical protein VLG47_07945 [Candidatus Saccharimonadales bacterium]|nr:hypothetical protein [Candidatus Saccharimonadales bacterium]